MVDQLAPSERHSFIHQGRKVYEWDQTLTEVNIYVTLPEGVRARELFVELSSNHLRLGIKPNPPYLDVCLKPFPFFILFFGFSGFYPP